MKNNFLTVTFSDHQMMNILSEQLPTVSFILILRSKRCQRSNSPRQYLKPTELPNHDQWARKHDNVDEKKNPARFADDL